MREGQTHISETPVEETPNTSEAVKYNNGTPTWNVHIFY
jgi:hypothetical protein